MNINIREMGLKDTALNPISDKEIEAITRVIHALRASYLTVKECASVLDYTKTAINKCALEQEI